MQFVYVLSWFLLFIFELRLALALNIGTILVCQLTAGCAGGAKLIKTDRRIIDLWE